MRDRETVRAFVKQVGSVVQICIYIHIRAPTRYTRSLRNRIQRIPEDPLQPLRLLQPDAKPHQANLAPIPSRPLQLAIVREQHEGRAERKICAQAGALSRVEVVVEGDCVGELVECAGKQTAVAAVGETTGVVVGAGGAVFGVVYLFDCRGMDVSGLVLREQGD